MQYSTYVILTEYEVNITFIYLFIYFYFLFFYFFVKPLVRANSNKELIGGKNISK